MHTEHIQVQILAYKDQIMQDLKVFGVVIVHKLLILKLFIVKPRKMDNIRILKFTLKLKQKEDFYNECDTNSYLVTLRTKNTPKISHLHGQGLLMLRKSSAIFYQFCFNFYTFTHE